MAKHNWIAVPQLDMVCCSVCLKIKNQVNSMLECTGKPKTFTTDSFDIIDDIDVIEIQEKVTQPLHNWGRHPFVHSTVVCMNCLTVQSPSNMLEPCFAKNLGIDLSKYHRLEEMMTLLQEIYSDEQKKTGNKILPYCTIQDKNSGELVVYAKFPKCAKAIMKALKEIV